MTAVSLLEDDPQAIRNAIGMFPYIKAAGSSVIEDYRRIVSISERFNEIVGFIAECGMQGVKQSPEYIQLQELINATKAEIKSTKDRNQQAVKRHQLKTIEASVHAMSQSQIGGLEKWLLDGIKLWITTSICPPAM